MDKILITSAFTGPGYSGTISLITLSFELNCSDVTMFPLDQNGCPLFDQSHLIINSAKLLDSNGKEIEIQDLVHGIILPINE